MTVQKTKPYLVTGLTGPTGSATAKYLLGRESGSTLKGEI